MRAIKKCYVRSGEVTFTFNVAFGWIKTLTTSLSFGLGNFVFLPLILVTKNGAFLPPQVLVLPNINLPIYSSSLEFMKEFSLLPSRQPIKPIGCEKALEP